jgi:hypothetical protein
MSDLKIKIVGVEGDSVLVKYASVNSLKSIDDYPAVAYQPKQLGLASSNIDAFIEYITPTLAHYVAARDTAERVEFDTSQWVGHETTHRIVDQVKKQNDAPIQFTGSVSYIEKLSLVRQERNKRLLASDWTQADDVKALHSTEWVTAWKEYRQALRDITAELTMSNIDTVTYPIPPQ